KTAIEMDERPPMLPVWLSPVQVRVLPIAERHLEYAGEIVSRLLAADVRADLDDRSETLGKKIRNAAQEWVPYVVVIGDSEMEGKLTVNVRETGEKIQMTLDELIETLRSETEGM